MHKAATRRSSAQHGYDATLIPLGEGRTVEVDGMKIAVFRTRSGRVFAAQAECPHMGGPLADGVIAGSTVICPLHEFRFDLEDGKPIGNSCQSIKTYPVEVSEAGRIRIGTLAR